MYNITIEGGASFACAPDDTLMRAALRAGLGLAYECNTGACGACKVEMVSGEVVSNRADAPAISDRDRAKNRVLGCQSRPLGDCTIKAKLRPECVPAHRPQRFDATLSSVENITHDLREFRFTGATPAQFLPGQYALLTVPGVPGPRAYSMSNIGHNNEWHFQIKQVPGGKGSAQLFDHTPIGTRITIDGPYGMAYLRPESPRDVICIGGGSGLAPLISIARGMAADATLADRQLHFFYGARGPADVCGESMLAALPGYGERIHFHAAISMPELDTEKTWQGKVGFIHEIVREHFGESLPQFEYYFAGPPVMAQAVNMMLVKAKVPMSQVHYDSFY